jgi:ubiquinone/menaquinone biosynthesis C-methylase UbiE
VSATPDFGARAAVYDALRPQDGPWWERFDAIVRLGDLRAKRILDVGCGTGALAAALADRAGAKVWGVEPSAEMRAVARSRLPRSVGVREGAAEALPFREGWFDAVVFSLVVHLVDRERAFAEASRVLRPGGSVVVATFAHEHFDTYWASRFFPSIGEIDRRRFPSEQRLAEELAAAGFRNAVAERLSSVHTITREHALDRIRGRHISTFDLLEEAELRAGTRTAEEELPPELEVRLEQLVVSARAR